MVSEWITKKIMEDRFCKKCNKVCHCVEEDRSDCECSETSTREEDATYE